MRAKRKFVDLSIEEVSLVSNPACPPATIRITKAKGQMERINVVVKASKVECRICGNKVEDADQFCRHCGAPFYKAAPKEDAVPDEKIEEAQVAEPAPDALSIEGGTVDSPAAEAAPEPEQTAEPAPEAAPEPAPAEIPVVASADPTPAPEPVTKAEPTEVEKANLRVAELEKAVRERDRVIKVKDAGDRVSRLMKSVPAGDELADRLVSLSELDADLAKYVEELLVKCAALIDTNALPQVAASSTAPESGPALDRANAIAKKLAQERGISVSKALAEVWKSNPDLYKAYESEKLEAR